jgi:hypothetical protein
LGYEKRIQNFWSENAKGRDFAGTVVTKFVEGQLDGNVWIELPQDVVKWRSVNTMMKYQVL